MFLPPPFLPREENVLLVPMITFNLYSSPGPPRRQQLRAWRLNETCVPDAMQSGICVCGNMVSNIQQQISVHSFLLPLISDRCGTVWAPQEEKRNETIAMNSPRLLLRYLALSEPAASSLYFSSQVFFVFHAAILSSIISGPSSFASQEISSSS